jgi:hypothetical protein
MSVLASTAWAGRHVAFLAIARCLGYIGWGSWAVVLLVASIMSWAAETVTVSVCAPGFRATLMVAAWSTEIVIWFCTAVWKPL